MVNDHLRRMTIPERAAVAAASLAMGLSLAGVAAGQSASGGPIFPEPFMVEHQVVQTLPDGDRFVSDPVTDYYGGSWIISVRADGSRMVVDLARRELTEIRPDRGSFTTLSFGRFAELSRRYVSAERGSQPTAADDESVQAPEYRYSVAERPAMEGLAGKSGGPEGNGDLVRRQGVRRLTVSVRRAGHDEIEGSMDLWLDPSIRFTARAQQAMGELESAVVAGGRANESLSFAHLAAEGRRASGGALVFRSARPLAFGAPAEEAGSMEDVALRVEAIDVFPDDLLEVPEGFERAPHPLELMVAHAESEAELRARMGVTTAE